MSIKLEWDVSEAPRDDEFSPSLSTDNPKWLDPPCGAQTGRRPPSRRRRWAWLAVFAFVAAAGAGLWYFTQTGWQRVSSSVLAAIQYEDQQAAQGATNLLLNVQDRGNVDWLAVRRDETLARQPAPLPLPMLNLDPAPASVADLTVLDAQFMQASVRRQFTTPDGQALSFSLPQFYRRDTSGVWLRSAPPGSFWGNWQDWHGTNLDIRYSDRDADFVNQTAARLDQQLADACAAWAGGCPAPTSVRLYLSGFVGSLEYNPLSNVEVRVEMSATRAVDAAPSDYFLSVPSPQIAGIPADEAARGYLTNYLAVRLIASLARHISTSPDGYVQRMSQAVQALGLTSADPGYAASERRRRAFNPGTAVPPLGDNAPARFPDRVPARVIWYTTAPGDTLPALAARFSLSLTTLQRANRLSQADQVAAGVKLMIPILNQGVAAP